MAPNIPVATPDPAAPRLKIDEPRYDQSTYWGRAKHFFITTNPLNMMKSGEELDHAKDIVTRYRKGEDIPGLSEDDIWDAKAVYDSAFHPDTGEKMISIGRMSAQVPMNMGITGCMLTFYKSRKEVIFWQWVNQTFNAVVNFSNRSGDSPISETQLATSYVLATGGALGTALTLNNLVKKAPSIIGRFVPFAAVAAANCVNIPMMRSKELTDGITITDENGNRVGESKKAAKIGIASVVFSRILMASPGMIFPPILMDRLERGNFLKSYRWMSGPIQVLLCGFCLTFATPMCCALFPQKSSIAVSSLEPELQERIKKLPNAPTVVYYNKGL